MIFLTFKSGPHAGHQVEIDAERIEIGRDPAGALALQDEKCSWQHCALVKAEGGWTVTDLGSRNGTFVNGAQVAAHAPQRLGQGAVVKVGQSEIEVRYPEEPRSIQIARVARPASGGSLVLSVASGPLQGQAIKAQGERLVVGSGGRCDVVLPGASVAPQAAALVRHDERWSVERLDDKTDLRVFGGLVVFKAPLPAGAILQIGEHIVEVSYGAAEGEEKATQTIQLSDADRERVAEHIERFAGVLRENDRGSLEIRVQDDWDVSISLEEIAQSEPQGAATMVLGTTGDSTRAMSPAESEALADAIERFKLEISGGAATASALSAAASGLRLVAAPQAPPSARTMAMDVADAEQIKAMVEELRAAGRSAAQPSRPRTPSGATPAAAASHNPIQPWEGVGSGAFLVERDDTSVDPVPVPEEYRLRAKLIFVSGPHQERKVYLGEGPVSIGRASDSFVPLVDGLASRHHAEIRPKGKGYELVAAPEARNKPTVNGRPVTDRMRLDHRDLITIGASVIEYHAPNIDPLSENPLQTVMLPQPRYAVLGQVLVQWNLVIGRDPGSDLFLDHEGVERHHAELQFYDGGFRLLDKSSWGSFVNGRRVVDADLSDGDLLQIGGYQLRLHIEGLRCSLDVAQLAADIEVPEFAPDLDSASPERVIHRTTRGEGEEEKKPKKKQLQWVPPKDVQRSALGPLVVAVSVLLVLGVSAWAATSRQVFFLNKPLSQAHDSMAFMKAVKAEQGGELKAECTACHTPFGGVQEGSCEGCHAEQHPRAAHAEAHASGEAELTCMTCHNEHEGAARRTALLEGEACASCHMSRHEKLLAVTPGPVEVEAPDREDARMPAGMVSSLRADVSPPELHRLHEGLERRCAGCHANEDQSGPVDPRTSCLRCHDVREQLADLRCNGCHGEHRAAMTRVASVGGPAFGGPISWQGAGVLVLLFFVPLGIVVAFHQAARRAMERAAARRAAAAPPPGGGGGEGGVKLVHNINIDKCVGCASCVNACPHDVLELEPKRHKSTVVRPDNCKQCRACEQICPSGALTMAPAGAPPRMVELPDLDSHYMTNIPGMYLIGEASGKSLVKNANNLGRRVIEHMAIDGAGPGAAAAAGVDVEVVAVGSGPGGLSVGISALKMGMRHVVFEKDRKFSSTIQTYPKGKELLAEPPDVENIGPLPVWDSYKEEILGRWNEELKKYPELDIRMNHEVTKIVQRPEGGFEVTTSQCTVTCLRVVLATGTRGNPRGLKIPGGDSEKVNYVLVDPEEHKGDSCMVVGGGDSAVEAAMALAEPALGNKVAISYRRGDFGRIKPRNQERLNAMVEAGQITLYMETNPAEVKDGAVVLKRNDGELVEVPNDALYCMLGADPPVKWLQTLGVRYVQKPESWSPGPTDDLSFLDLERAAS